MQRCAGGAAVVGATLGVSACTSDPPERSASAAATVTVDLYSGRENLIAPLSDRAAAELREAIAAHVPGSESVVTPFPGLGFRGFVVTDPANTACTAVRVLRKSIVCGTSAGMIGYPDEDGTAYTVVWEDIKDDLTPEEIVAIRESGE